MGWRPAYSQGPSRIHTQRETCQEHVKTTTLHESNSDLLLLLLLLWVYYMNITSIFALMERYQSLLANKAKLENKFANTDSRGVKGKG